MKNSNFYNYFNNEISADLFGSEENLLKVVLGVIGLVVLLGAALLAMCVLH